MRVYTTAFMDARVRHWKRPQMRLEINVPGAFVHLLLERNPIFPRAFVHQTVKQKTTLNPDRLECNILLFTLHFYYFCFQHFSQAVCHWSSTFARTRCGKNYQETPWTNAVSRNSRPLFVRKSSRATPHRCFTLEPALCPPSSISPCSIPK